jgi:peptidyl-prolyl cis-trans isomerase SurA
MNKNRYLIIIALIFFTNNAYSFDIENKILIKIENEIITSLDIQNEYKYLIALNPDIKRSNKEDIIKLSKRSILQERIKKIEINKNFNNPKVPEKFLKQIMQKSL